MLPQTHLPLDHPRAKEFLDRYFPGKPVLSVPLIGGFPTSQCYGNVQAVVRQKGGSAQAGWLLTLFPEHFIEAMHHAVWRARDGKLYDVTAPAFPPMGQQPISFIEDHQTALDENVDPGVASLFLQLDLDAGTADYIKLTRRRMELGRRQVTLIMRGHHYRILPDGGIDWIESTFDPELHRVMSDLDAVDKRRNRYVARFNAGDFSYLS